MSQSDSFHAALKAGDDAHLPRERYAGQVERARAAGLSLPTIESVRQGCYSDEQISALIHDLAVRAAARMLIFGARFQGAEGMATPAAGDASDSQHGRLGPSGETE